MLYVSNYDHRTSSNQNVAIGRGPYTSTSDTTVGSLRCPLTVAGPEGENHPPVAEIDQDTPWSVDRHCLGLNMTATPNNRMGRRSMTRDLTRVHLVRVAVAAMLLSWPLTVLAERGGNRSPLQLPVKPRVSNSQSMQKAFISLPGACRKAVQGELASKGLARLPADGAWSNEVAKGMARYVESFPTLGYGWHSIAGAKGLYWHISFQEPSCPMPTTINGRQSAFRVKR